MKLELLHLSPRKDKKTKAKNILFVHGICVGAWVWEDHFLPYFANEGYNSWALSLRGHGLSDGADNINYNSFSDYVEDLKQITDKIGEDVIIVGHSMGGAVVQRWLRDGGKAKAVVLMASVPPWGLASAALNMLFTSPRLYQEIFKMSWLGINSSKADILKLALFSDAVSDKDFSDFMKKANDESARVGCELQGMVPIAPIASNVPMMVIGAGNDKFIPRYEIRNTASYYKTKAVIIEGASHAIMLETYWKEAADSVLNWIDNLKD